ncbi:MAG: hypothetical protein Q9174_004694, partial [Haloplaca sp. 1 TL-2023]
VEDIHTNEIVAERFAVTQDSAANRVEALPPVETQHAAPLELRVLSWPLPPRGPPKRDLRFYPNYVYFQHRHPAYIYHVETGINPNHLDFHRRQIEWLFTPRAMYQGVVTRTETPDGGGHGTCTASKAAGRIFGASKSATLVVVKMADLTEASVAGVLGTVNDDIISKGRQGRSVVTISWGSTAPVAEAWPYPAGKPWLRLLLEGLDRIDQHSFLFAAAGNAGQTLDPSGKKRHIIDTAPAVYVSNGGLLRSVTVGMCDITGNLVPDSQESVGHDNDHLYAPGDAIVCPTGIHSGTSFGK